MSYEEFKVEYESLFNRMMKYDPNLHAGASIYAQKMADLCEEYPEFEERFDNEQELKP